MTEIISLFGEIVGPMKALKSPLAKKLLADPKVGDQLSKAGQDGRVIYVRDASGRIIQQYRAIVVPKAA